MSGKFEVYKDQTGKFRFRLKAANGELIATSEAYDSKLSCMNGINLFRKHAVDSPIVEVPK
jgi:uncharacterized protein